MSERNTLAAQPKASSPISTNRNSVLQRQCACGTHTTGGGECAECGKKKFGLQRKLMIGASNDPLELEADRVADQVLAAPTHAEVSGTPPRIQRHAGQAVGETGTAPASVDHVLADSGRPLDPVLRQDMEHRFGHDFSQVRVHSGGAAERSARDVNANAYTVGHHIVFGASRLAPETHDGRRLIAHELTHVVQQSGAGGMNVYQSNDKRGLSPFAPPGATEMRDLRRSRASESGRLQRKPKGGKDSPKTEACPPMERNEREEAAKAQLQLVERIAQQEWLIYGFPIGGTEISGAEAGRFISMIVRSLMQGKFVYMTGQDPVEVLGFSDCFAGPKVDNHAIRQLRAANFCAGVKDHYASTPKAFPALIRSCEPAPTDQYVGSNATRADRAQNRSILIRRVPAKVQFQKDSKNFPFDPTFGPSAAHCAVYSTDLAREALGPIYPHNGHISCMVTPDEPHNNCVRACLQDKMWNLLANAKRDRKPNDRPMDIDIACPLIWKHHRDCYHDCACANGFIEYPAFDVVCNMALMPMADSAAINVFNRCMPATKDGK